MRDNKADRRDAVSRLREFVNPGDTIYCTLRHVSRSGMMRVIDLHVIRDNEPRWIAPLAARACGMAFDDKRQGIRIGGCGMDMGFAIVYDLAYSLFKDGFDCIGENCPSNDHSNGDRDYSPHRHSDPGYSLKHRWL